MAANKRKLADSQISSLIESLPGIASVLRSPVADAMVAMIRAAVGLEKFSEDHAIELMHFAVRRGLIETDEADEVMADVRAATKMARLGMGRTGSSDVSRRSRIACSVGGATGGDMRSGRISSSSRSIDFEDFGELMTSPTP